MARKEDVERARRLLKTYGGRLTPEERRVLANLLARIETGNIRRDEAVRMLTGALRSRGMTADEAMKRLRRTPYYGLVNRLLPDR